MEKRQLHEPSNPYVRLQIPSSTVLANVTAGIHGPPFHTILIEINVLEMHSASFLSIPQLEQALVVFSESTSVISTTPRCNRFAATESQRNKSNVKYL